MDFFKNKNSGHKKVTNLLKKYAFLRSFKVLIDYKFEHKGKIVQIDNILVGFFGVIVVTDLNYSGEVYIEADKNSEWLNIKDNKKTRFENSLNQNIEYCNSIKMMLRKEKILNVQIESLVVFTDNQVELYKPNKTPIILLKDLSKLLHLAKYEIDNEYDVDEIVEILNKNSRNSN